MTGDEWLGQTIAGKYRVEDLLGKGGMGLVLHARHVRLDEEVAIKLLLPAVRDVPGMTTRFVREAQAASRIKSRHVARVTDVDVLPDGTPYMIMEYLDGMSLAALRRQRGALDVPVAVGMVLQACDAIGEAHALGIVHRDLKPANLFLARGRDGEEIVKVLDFGISKIDAPGEQDTTKTGQMMGSPRYMAPEQMLSMHDVDGRSDIWSLGAILFDFVAGRPPFLADTTPQLCSLVLHGTPPPPRQFRADLPEALEEIILRCLSREPAGRFSTIAELVAALAPFAPPGAHIPTPRSPSSAGVRQTGSFSGVRPLPGRARTDATPPPLADDKPTENVPARALHVVSPSAPPTSARGATVSVWNSALHDRSSTRRRPRTVALAIAASLALSAAAGAAFLGRRAPPPSVSSAEPAPSAAATVRPAPETTGEPPLPRAVATAEPQAAIDHQGGDTQTPAGGDHTPPLEIPRSPASGAPPGPAQSGSSVVRAPLRPAKKAATETDTAQADPFAGKRR